MVDALVEEGRRLAAEGIAYIVLKGPALALSLYGREALRAYGDLDVLVRRSDRDRAIAALVVFQPELRAALARLGPDQRQILVLRDYQEQHPAAMRSFNDDLEACLVYLRCPLAHHKSIRTTNLLERAFQESRRRTKVIPKFFTEKACLKLVFSALWKTSQRWRKVTMTELEQQQLKLLRKELQLPLYNR